MRTRASTALRRVLQQCAAAADADIAGAAYRVRITLSLALCDSDGPRQGRASLLIQARFVDGYRARTFEVPPYRFPAGNHDQDVLTFLLK